MKPAIASKALQYVPWVVGLGGAAAASFFVWKSIAPKMELPADLTGPQGREMGAIELVQNADRANGVHRELLGFLTWWRNNGPFQILVAPDGGVRISESKQASFYARGLTKAKTLRETPHGRGGALDLWPVGFDPSKPLDQQPVMKARFEEMGRIAKSFGFVWGGDWGWDYPHIELKGWRALPFTVGVAGMSGLGALSAGEPATAALAPSNAAPIVGIAMLAAVTYQMFIRKDEGPRTLHLCECDERLAKLKAA